MGARTDLNKSRTRRLRRNICGVSPERGPEGCMLRTTPACRQCNEERSKRKSRSRIQTRLSQPIREADEHLMARAVLRSQSEIPIRLPSSDGITYRECRPQIVHRSPRQEQSRADRRLQDFLSRGIVPPTSYVVLSRTRFLIIRDPMNSCAQCGAKTELYISGTPICIKCAEDYDRVLRERLTRREKLDPPLEASDKS